MQPSNAYTLADFWHSHPSERRIVEDEIIDLACHIMRDRLPQGDIYQEPAIVKQFLVHALAPKLNETFACMFLSEANHLIRYEEIFFGPIVRDSIRPCDVARRALALNAPRVIFAHNHVCSGAEPSATDIDVTRILAKTLRLLDIVVVDHVVIGADGSAVSFLERGML